MTAIDEATLSRIEKDHAAGLTSVEILDVFAQHGIALSEATLRKYVQLGLLPRSVRVGRKGKHQGSQGIYPVSVVRQILRIKQMMAERYTIEPSDAASAGFSVMHTSAASWRWAACGTATPTPWSARRSTTPSAPTARATRAVSAR